MDLSQQELPLTSYFTRGSKEARSRTGPYKKEKPADDPQSVARSSKRRKSNVQCSAASPLGGSAGQSNSRLTTLQLPTPATSTRKRTRNGRLELPAKTQLTSTGALLSSVEPNASEEDLVQLESGSISSELPQSSRKGTNPLVTPLAGRRRITKSIGAEFTPHSRLSNRGEAGIPTPRTLSQRISEPMDGIDDYSPLARNCHLPSKPSQVSPRSPDSGISHAVLPHAQHSTRSTVGLPCFPVDSDCRYPFYAREKNVSVQQDGVFVPPKQYCIQSKMLDGQPSDGHVIPMLPVPSSQSQYLLHLDATPKRKRPSQRIEHVISSQTQEEQELTLSTPRRPAATVGLSVGVSPGKYTRGNTQIPRLHCSERKSRLVYTLGSTPAGPPINSPAGPSRSFATKKELDELSFKSSSPSRRKKLTPYHSPSRTAKTPRRSPCHGSIGNIPPAHIEDSLTESESESDILKMKLKMTDKLSAVDLPSREMNQVSVARDACPLVRCGFAEGSIPSVEDDSATEAESDTEILHCVAAIGNKRPRGYRSQVSREDSPPPPVISPLVSPARSRIAAVPSIIGFTPFPTQEGAELGSRPSYSSTMEQPQTLSQSLPSVVRDFIRMFPGDESYPVDFPESLRV